MTSLPISAHSRPSASAPAQRTFNRPAQRPAGLLSPAGFQRRSIDAALPIHGQNRHRWDLPGSAATSAFVAAAILCLLTAALLLDFFWTRADLLQTRSLLQGVMLAGLAGLWTQLRHLQTRQARDSDLARLDELTGLPNRRALNEQLQALVGGRHRGNQDAGHRDTGHRDTGHRNTVHRDGSAGRGGAGVEMWSLLLVDIDHFKSVNDAHGHQAGDEVLRAVTLTLRQELREGDMLGRWGGEEFLALLPATGLEGALVAAERLRRAVALRTFPYAGSVTVSIGAASARPGDHLERTVARADAGMYRAKRAGRNRVAFSD